METGSKSLSEEKTCGHEERLKTKKEDEVFGKDSAAVLRLWQLRAIMK